MRRCFLLAFAIASSHIDLSQCVDKIEGKVVHISERTPPIYTCPENYEQRNTGHETICLRNVETPSIETCTIGELHDGVCIRQEQLIRVCPAGFQPTNEKSKKKKTHPLVCARVSVVSPEPHCLNGEYNSGVCDTERTASVVKVCPTAKIKHTSGCYEWVPVPKLLKCKQGFELHGNTCIGDEFQPCASENSLCFTGGDCSENAKQYKFEKKTKKIPPQKAGICEVQVETRPFEICPPEAHEAIKGSGCLVLREVQLEPYCPIQRGMIDEDGILCRGVFQEEPIFDCPLGHAPCDKQPPHGAAKCCRIDYAEPISSCRNGAEETNGKCIGTSAPELICEEGLTLDGEFCKGFQVVAPSLRYTITVEATKQHHKKK